MILANLLNVWMVQNLELMNFFDSCVVVEVGYLKFFLDYLDQENNICKLITSFF